MFEHQLRLLTLGYEYIDVMKVLTFVVFVFKWQGNAKVDTNSKVDRTVQRNVPS